MCVYDNNINVLRRCAMIKQNKTDITNQMNIDTGIDEIFSVK